MNLTRVTLVATFACFGFSVLTPCTAKTLQQARSQFVKGYNGQDYGAICDVLHKDASFRGSIYPEKWTHTRDNIITERYMSTRTCTDVKQGAKAETKPGGRSIGIMTLTLNPKHIRPIHPNYAIESGSFKMAVKPGFDAKPTSGPYVIIWTKTDDTWEIKQIDMHP